MANAENIRNGLIDKILSIKNEEFLRALDTLIISSAFDSETIVLNDEQRLMLEMSEKDIQDGKLISQDAMNKRNLEWLNEI